MPSSHPSARALTEAHRVHQARLGAITAAQTLATFDMLDVDDLDGTASAWLRVNTAIVANGKRQSARATANYYRAIRRLVIGSDGFIPTPVEDVDQRQVSTALLVTGVYRLRKAMSRGVLAAKALETAQVSAAGASTRLALEGGRQTLTTAVREDSRARGYERVTSGNACKFCAMLADRGAIYGEASVQFEAHDHCSCSGEPVFR